MKRYTFVNWCAMMLMSAMLSAVSCAKEDFDSSAAGTGGDDVVTVSFTVGAMADVRGFAEKGGRIGSGEFADRLVCAVYDNAGTLLKQYAEDDEHGNEYGQLVYEVERWPATVSLRMVRGQEYKVVFLAKCGDCEAYDTNDLASVKIDYSRIECNNPSYDLFCKTEPLTVVESGTRTVVMRRPLAQINIGMSVEDYERLADEGFGIVRSALSVHSAANELNVVDNSVNVTTADGAYDAAKYVEVDYAVQPVPALWFVGDGGEEEWMYVDLDGDGKFRDAYDENPEVFKYLSMCYILAPDRYEGTSSYSAVAEVSITLVDGEGRSCTISPDEESELKECPVQRNWSTNIILTRDMVSGLLK